MPMDENPGSKCTSFSGMPAAAPLFSIAELPAGTRLALAVSGGADSVALLRLAHGLAERHGWALTVLHVQHGLRGDAALADQAFVKALAGQLAIPCRVLDADVAGKMREQRLGMEEAGRLARYGWFRTLMAAGELDAVATGHTLDDQAETVLAKLLRGAWTSGLGGIHPTLRAADLPGEGTARGFVVRPLLHARREELRAWLRSLGQGWCEDETNADPNFTRNRIRAELLPRLADYNPNIAEQLAQMSVLARDDEQYWQAELDRVLPGLLLPGRPVRGGGRSSSTLPGEQTLAIEVDRLRALAPALARRVIRAMASRLGVALDFRETDEALALLDGSVGSTARRAQLGACLRAERTPRELRLVLLAAQGAASNGSNELPGAAPMPVPVPGEAEGFNVRLRVSCTVAGLQPEAILRAAKPSDRVTLRYTSGAPKRVKEVLERMGVPAPDRAGWPVLEWQGEIVWLRGAALAPTPLSRQLTVEDVTPAAAPPPATP
jgi:tRNA(Ile)-lysidine synthase